MINNYFFQFQLPFDKEYKIRVKKNMATLMIERLRDKQQPKKKKQQSQQPVQLQTQDSKRPRQLHKYMELIQKRAKKSFINATYGFPRTESRSGSRSSTPRSVKSMNGVIVYKLHLQNKTEKQVVSQEIQTKTQSYLNGYTTSRMLLKQKIFPRRPTKKVERIVTETSYSREKMSERGRDKGKVKERSCSRMSGLSMSTRFDRGNPLHNSVLNNKRLNNKSKLSNTSKLSNLSHYSSIH